MSELFRYMLDLRMHMREKGRGVRKELCIKYSYIINSQPMGYFDPRVRESGSYTSYLVSEQIH